MKIDRADILAELESLSDEKYRAFNERIVHTSGYRVIGVRMPDIKKIAGRYSDCYKELFRLDHDSFEEIMLKGAALAVARAPLCEKAEYIYRYADMADNWAQCDCFCSSLKVGKNDRELLMQIIENMIFSKREFVSRTGIVLLFSKLRDEQSADYALAVYEKLRAGDYYRDMAVAWGISVYCVYYPEKIASYLAHSPIGYGIKRMAAQKIRDSRRIPAEIKGKITRAVNLPDCRA